MFLRKETLNVKIIYYTEFYLTRFFEYARDDGEISDTLLILPSY